MMYKENIKAIRETHQNKGTEDDSEESLTNISFVWTKLLR